MDRNPSPKRTKSYCFCITRKRLLSLWLALLLLFVAAGLGAYAWLRLQEDRSLWEVIEYAKLAVGVLVCILFLI